MTSPSRHKINNALKRALPPFVQSKVRQLVFREATISDGWDRWARWYSGHEERHLGDEWNAPQQIGIDVAPEQIPWHLDTIVFAPFLGDCEVLLEIGPGGGRFTEILLPKCKTLIALDTSRTMLKLLAQRFRDSDQIEYRLGDGKGLTGIASNSVDAVFSYDVFIHLQHWDIYNYLCEIRRVLRPGGKGIIHHANSLSELGWRQFLREVPVSVGRHKSFNTFSVMTPGLMKEFVERAGLRHIQSVTDAIPRDCISLLQAPT